MKFKGYARADGQVGVRNYIGVIPTVFCANRVARQIADQVAGAIALNHPVGCSQVGEDLEITAKTLIAMGRHPNFAATLVVGLGCERFTAEEFFDKLKAFRKPADMILIQEEGDTLKTIEKGIKIVKRWAEDISNLQKEEVDLTNLIVGVKCGGTDATSGISANPAVGVMSDMVVREGGTIIFSEVNELLGAEHILAKRAANQEVADRIYQKIDKWEEKLRCQGTSKKYRHRGAIISTGNFDGGVSSVVEKALGNIYKSGTMPIEGVIDYAERPPKPGGVYLMDSPSHDGEVVTAFVGGGAQVVVFTTGRGTPAGFPFVPVVKVTGNSYSFEKMHENIDVNAGTIIQEEASIESVGKQIFDLVLSVASGKKVKAEILGHDELFCITRALVPEGTGIVCPEQ
ncbi:MAG: UxaA family hydrolase [Deltaproteobacteria bacterium]|nr:UxaA family hydrolase [Deltaproteobacteria bacterium]MBW1962773.1 UxaA family hydrolase [Deltaproteobacteria bacterium]MBW2153546.1 UxaA family hydrolase [Deltaproteobacteria bacterium]